jgi:hypothetical protein
MIFIGIFQFTYIAANNVHFFLDEKRHDLVNLNLVKHVLFTVRI